MRIITHLIVLAIYGVLIAQAPTSAVQAPEPPAFCAPRGKAHMRTTLYFGLAYPAGTVTEAQWRAFLPNEVTPRFPHGLTVWEATGQWRRSDGKIERERAKVLLLVHPDAPGVRTALANLVASYKRAFQQESVLWESDPVCAAL